ncbi:beta-defensin 122-like [Rhynchonycteris naso]
MKPFLLTLVVLVLLAQVIPGSAEACWNLRGTCREICTKHEKVYVFCLSGKLCCVRPKFHPDVFPQSAGRRRPRARE